MKPIQYVLLWVGEAFLYILVLVLLFIMMPEVKFYEWIRIYAGVIPGDAWDKYYFLGLCIASLLIVSVIIFLTALVKRKRA